MKKTSLPLVYFGKNRKNQFDAKDIIVMTRNRIRYWVKIIAVPDPNDTHPTRDSVLGLLSMDKLVIMYPKKKDTPRYSTLSARQYISYSLSQF
jgi:hypothetical protein